jgi:hypothetical protein
MAGSTTPEAISVVATQALPSILLNPKVYLQHLQEPSICPYLQPQRASVASY